MTELSENEKGAVEEMKNGLYLGAATRGVLAHIIERLQKGPPVAIAAELIGQGEDCILMRKSSYDELKENIQEARNILTIVEWNMCVGEDACEKCHEDDAEEQCQICLAHNHNGHKPACSLAKFFEVTKPK
jgi:hypothetical protein